MVNDELLRRAQDLSARCRRTGQLTHTGFLTPAEQVQLLSWAKKEGYRVILHGGLSDCERKVLFFLPDWMEDLPVEEYICVVRYACPFGEAGHRDYMGAILSYGISRQWVGDIRLSDKGAFVFCLPSVSEHLKSLEQVGRNAVQGSIAPLSSVEAAPCVRTAVSFTVQSMRLDAIAGELFHLSRTTAAKLIVSGAASLNYLPCLKTDAPVKEGDILSLRGYGKGQITAFGGTSRKGRTFITAEIFL